MYQFLNNTGQIFNSQCGFCSKLSCENTIQELVGHVVKGYEQNKFTIAVYLDLSKAFDTIPHHILYQKMEKYGIRGNSLDWFKSYLTMCQLRVKCNVGAQNETTISDTYWVDVGTPQGSCLGPLIFLIYKNDLHHHLLFCKCILFADDTTIYFSHSNIRYLEWCIQQDLLLLSDWFKANRLTLNADKSVYILFNKKINKSSRMGSISFDKVSIPQVHSTKVSGSHHR